MAGIFRSIDDLLRGRFTRREDLVAGRVEVPSTTLVWAGFLCGAIYGVAMGVYAVLRPGEASFQQLFATAIKVPLLFLLTLVVTFPSLYVVSALFDSRLRFQQTLRLLLAAMAANLALLASFAPVTVFFTLSTESYPFMILLNVAFFGVAGFTGLAFLRKALDGVFSAGDPNPPESRGVDVEITEPEAARKVPSTRRPGDPTPSRRIFTIWTFIYAIVGAQMGWILRPFVGNPDLPFTWFRPRQSNFFEAILAAIMDLAR
jgi:hypothetical protein